MGMTSSCPEGDAFVTQRLTARSGGIGAAICGASGVLQQAQPGGPLADVLLLGRGAPLQFNGADIVRAANTVLQIGRDLAPLMGILPEEAEQVAMMLFALALDKFLDNVNPAATNWVHGSTINRVATTTPASLTSTTTSCATETTKSCIAYCRDVGMIEACMTSCAVDCATGSPKGESVEVTKWLLLLSVCSKEV